MLNHRKVTVVSESSIDGEKVATFAAVLDLDKLEVSTTARYVNGTSYMDHRDYVRSDMEQFERLVYDIQDMMQSVEPQDEPYEQTSFDEIAEEAVEG